MTETSNPTDLPHALMTSQARMFAASLSQTIEALDFLKRRFERDRQMLTDLSQAPDSAAAVAVLTAFCERTFSDYSAETGRLACLIAATAEQIGEGLQDEALALMGGSPRRH
jgi:hypothetical protein